MLNVAIALLVLGLTSLVVTAVGYATAALRVRRRGGGALRPAISVLKPLKGEDPELYDNLAAIVRQDYPCFEVIFAAADRADPALAVARRIKRDFPDVLITVLAGTPPFGENGKVQNLAAMARRARFDWFLISDSNVRPRPDYLETMACELTGEVRLVSSLLLGEDEESLGGTLESLHLNAFVAGVVTAADAIANHPCVVGKSMLFRRVDLDALGGFAAVKDVLAEDYLLGQMFHRAGMKVALSMMPLRVVHRGRRVADFFNRHLRWHQMRRWVAPVPYALEPLLNPTAWFFSAAILAVLAKTPALVFASVTLMLSKCALDAGLAYHLGRRSGLAGYVWVLPKDLLIFGLWVTGWLHRTVIWRGRAMRITHGSRLSPVSADVERVKQVEAFATRKAA